MVGISRDKVKDGLHEEPWGEQYFPGLTEYGAEENEDVVAGVLSEVVGAGTIARMARKVRKHPWQSMGVAVGVGALLGMAVGGARCDCDAE